MATPKRERASTTRARSAQVERKFAGILASAPTIEHQGDRRAIVRLANGVKVIF